MCLKGKNLSNIFVFKFSFNISFLGNLILSHFLKFLNSKAGYYRCRSLIALFLSLSRMVVKRFVIHFSIGASRRVSLGNDQCVFICVTLFQLILFMVYMEPTTFSFALVGVGTCLRCVGWAGGRLVVIVEFK